MVVYELLQEVYQRLGIEPVYSERRLSDFECAEYIEVMEARRRM